MPHADNTIERTPRGSALARLAVVAVFGFAVIAGCGGGGTSAPPAAVTPTASTPAPSTSTTYSAALCSAAAEFQTAANAIVPLDATKVGTEGVKTALQNLETAARNLATAAKDQFGPQVDALEQSLASLRTTISGLSDQTSLSAKLGAVTASVSGVEQAAKPIMDSVRAGCASVPPVETPPAS
jgi:hypothetical protein